MQWIHLKSWCNLLAKGNIPSSTLFILQRRCGKMSQNNNRDSNVKLFSCFKMCIQLENISLLILRGKGSNKYEESKTSHSAEKILSKLIELALWLHWSMLCFHIRIDPSSHNTKYQATWLSGSLGFCCCKTDLDKDRGRFISSFLQHKEITGILNDILHHYTYTSEYWNRERESVLLDQSLQCSYFLKNNLTIGKKLSLLIWRGI